VSIIDPGRRVRLAARYAGFSLRQPPPRLLAMIFLSIAAGADRLMVSPCRDATVLAAYCCARR
jgi:hypothetical protein